MNDLKPRNNDEAPLPVEIPIEALSEEALNGIIENFVLREGTDYGAEEISLATKLNQVRRQLAKREVRIVFDPGIESVTILTAQDFAKLQMAKDKDLKSRI